MLFMGYGLWAMGYGLWAIGYGLQTGDWTLGLTPRLPSPVNRQPSTVKILHGFQVVDELVDHLVDLLAFGFRVRTREIVEANAPHGHLTRTVCAVFHAAVDRSAHVFAGK